MYGNPIVTWKPGTREYKIVSDDENGEIVTLYQCKSKAKAKAIREFLVNIGWRKWGNDRTHLKGYLRHRVFEQAVFGYDEIEFSVKFRPDQNHLVRVNLTAKDGRKEIVAWETSNKEKAKAVVEFLTNLRDDRSQELLIEFFQKLYS